jgi:hypothetical protein
MKAAIILLTLVCLFCTTSCKPPTGSAFLGTFDPKATLKRIGGPVGISYSGDSSGSSSSVGEFNDVRIAKEWTFSFQGSAAQLSDQLDRLRADVERQLSSSGATIEGRGRWNGNFSGFNFDYRANRRIGFIRVTGVSLQSGEQGLEFLVHEY